eukprot:1161654-Pelagomonas_calceolata.AAC.6
MCAGSCAAGDVRHHWRLGCASASPCQSPPRTPRQPLQGKHVCRVRCCRGSAGGWGWKAGMFSKPKHELRGEGLECWYLGLKVAEHEQACGVSSHPPADQFWLVLVLTPIACDGMTGGTILDQRLWCTHL